MREVRQGKMWQDGACLWCTKDTLRGKLNCRPNPLINYFLKLTIEALNCQSNSPTEANE